MQPSAIPFPCLPALHSVQNEAAGGEENPADLMTKIQDAATIKRLMEKMGFFVVVGRNPKAKRLLAGEIGL